MKYLDETADKLHGTCVLNLANVKYAKDWYQIRGKKIATVFLRNPMTSLNPIITIGKQITSIIMKHQDVTESEARAKALDLMKRWESQMLRRVLMIIHFSILAVCGRELS